MLKRRNPVNNLFYPYEYLFRRLTQAAKIGAADDPSDLTDVASLKLLDQLLSERKKHHNAHCEEMLIG